tara:strand:+ start:88 stop:1761 length:1674 start_codon:yes stop_codon:yes gene_type:complete
MQNVRQRGKSGIYYVVQNVPIPARPAFGGKGQVWVSLRTSDKAEARSKAAAILAGLDQRIRVACQAARAMAAPTATNKLRVPIHRPHAIEAINRWRVSTIDADYHAAINGLGLPPQALTPHERSDLQSGRYGGDSPFLSLMVSALATQGIPADVDHPALRYLAQSFSTAILSVEHYRQRFGLGLIEGWPEESDPVTGPVAVTQTATKAGMTISQLRDAWDSVKPLEPRQKGYIKRLIESIGDRDITKVEPLDLDRFLIDLRRFPMTKRLVEDVPFTDLLDAYPESPRLHVKTVWNWLTTYKGLFAFAVSRRLIDFNPAADTMKKPSAETVTQRFPFDEADLTTIFSSPAYQGHSGRLDGNRDKPGEVITRDDRYWLPVAALATGMRLEELASIKRTEVINRDGITAFDLTARPTTGANRVKNGSARRMVPISAALEATGFLAWLNEGEGEFVFAGLEESADGKRGTKFGKWFGRFAKANATIKGEGIDHPSKTFHSFRHTWKRAARMSEAKEEVHDLLSGHSDGNGVARGYGRGADLATLKEAMDLISIPALERIKP